MSEQEIAPCPNCGMPVKLVSDGVECTGRICGYQILRGGSLGSGQSTALGTHQRIATAIPVERVREVLQRMLTTADQARRADIHTDYCHYHAGRLYAAKAAAEDLGITLGAPDDE